MVVLSTVRKRNEPARDAWAKKGYNTLLVGVSDRVTGVLFVRLNLELGWDTIYLIRIATL